MKSTNHLLLLLICCTVLSSCTHYTQLYETKATSPMKIEGGRYTFENDTIRIIYNFWADSGVLSFQIFNKLNVPLYIDWKKSSFVQNGQKLDYWADQESTKGEATGISYNGYYRMSFHKTKSSSTTIRPERVIFIAPESSTNKNQFYLYPVKTPLANFKTGQVSVARQKKAITAKYNDFNAGNSPLIFRNFLTLSLDEQSTKEIYIDNGFYVSKVSELKKKYVFKEVDDGIHPIQKSVYMYDPTFFYVNL